MELAGFEPAANAVAFALPLSYSPQSLTREYGLYCQQCGHRKFQLREVGDRTLKPQDLGPPIPNRTGSLSLHTALKDPPTTIVRIWVIC
jgi:hypothetical protein